MAYKYLLYPNKITGGGHDHSALPSDLESMEIDDIIHDITVPGSILKYTECRAVIQDFFRIIGRNLEEGIGFNSEYIKIHPSVTGIFEGPDDQFDPERHEKKVKVFAGSTLKKSVQKMPVEKVHHKGQGPLVEAVTDLRTGSVNEQISSGHVLDIRGRRLAIDAEAEDEGLFLQSDPDGTYIKIPHIHFNKPSHLMAVLPDTLPSGTYRLEIRNRSRRGKTLLIGRLGKSLVLPS